jgi:hypothetical protein
MNPDNSFLGAYLKVDRANAHIQSIVSMSQPLSTQLYELSWIKAIGLPCMFSYAPVSSDPDSKVMELAFLPKVPIPQIFACIIGDAIHNLRTALDYAATAVVRTKEVGPEYVTFPFHEKRENLNAAQSTGMRQIQAALPNMDVEGFFKDTIKSYSDGNPDLWTLSKADKVDKHNFLVPAVTVAEIDNSILHGQSGQINFISINSRMGNDASRPFGFVRADTTDGFPKHSDFQVSAQIAFPHGEYFGGREVVPTLANLAQLVWETLEAFEQFAVDAGVYTAVINKGV